jgi:hypothetical protein
MTVYLGFGSGNVASIDHPERTRGVARRLRRNLPRQGANATFDEEVTGMASIDDRSPDTAPLVLDVATMTDEELEELARALVAAQNEAVRRLQAR